MRKLKLQMQTSVDAFVAGPNGEMDWMVWDWDEALKKYVWELTAPVDTILLGRKMAKGFIDAWTTRLADPDTADEFSRRMVEARKIVFSKTLDRIEGANAETNNGELAGEIDALKNSEGGDIIVYGGGEFVASLIGSNLIDEYHLFVNPVAIGRGMTIFEGLEEKLKLELRRAETFACGIVDLCYVTPRS